MAKEELFNLLDDHHLHVWVLHQQLGEEVAGLGGEFPLCVTLESTSPNLVQSLLISELEQKRESNYELVDNQGQKIFLLLRLCAKEIVDHRNGLVLDKNDCFMGQGLQRGDEFKVAGLELALKIPRQDGLI